MRLIVTGDRAYSNKRFLRAVLTGLLFSIPEDEEFVLIEGMAKGADEMAGQWADENAPRVQHISFPAKWDKLGPAAGPARNVQMLKEGEPTLVVAFHDDIENSKGTKHMVDISRQTLNLPVYIVSRPPSLNDQRAFFGPNGAKRLL